MVILLSVLVKPPTAAMTTIYTKRKIQKTTDQSYTSDQQHLHTVRKEK